MSEVTAEEAGAQEEEVEERKEVGEEEEEVTIVIINIKIVIIPMVTIFSTGRKQRGA